MNDRTNIVDSLLLVSGVTYSALNIETVLGIIILVLQILWFSLKFYIKLKEILKDGEIDEEELTEIGEDVSDFIGEVKNHDTDTEQR